jgi:hypothetical protein
MKDLANDKSLGEDMAAPIVNNQEFQQGIVDTLATEGKSMMSNLPLGLGDLFMKQSIDADWWIQKGMGAADLLGVGDTVRDATKGLRESVVSGAVTKDKVRGEMVSGVEQTMQSNPRGMGEDVAKGLIGKGTGSSSSGAPTTSNPFQQEFQNHFKDSLIKAVPQSGNLNASLGVASNVFGGGSVGDLGGFLGSKVNNWGTQLNNLFKESQVNATVGAMEMASDVSNMGSDVAGAIKNNLTAEHGKEVGQAYTPSSPAIQGAADVVAGFANDTAGKVIDSDALGLNSTGKGMAHLLSGNMQGFMDMFKPGDAGAPATA